MSAALHGTNQAFKCVTRIPTYGGLARSTCLKRNFFRSFLSGKQGRDLAISHDSPSSKVSRRHLHIGVVDDELDWPKSAARQEEWERQYNGWKPNPDSLRDQLYDDDPKEAKKGKAKPPPKPRKRKGLGEGNFGDLSSPEIPALSECDVGPKKVPPKLQHGLDRVLFSPGVHVLKDHRTNVYNYPEILETIPSVFDFAFDRVRPFVPSSKDLSLVKVAQREGRKFCGSTSSLTGILAHIYFLISGNKPPNYGHLSLAYKSKRPSYTAGQRIPVSVIYNYHNGVYAIDSDPEEQHIQALNILLWQGTMLEKFLTKSPEEFNLLMRDKTPDYSPPKKSEGEAYRYSLSGKFAMRSQLDCYDIRLPGSGVFDIKTRGSLPIRMDVLNYQENSIYELKTLRGRIESFEREYLDLIKSAFLKYGFQARIGNMDGVLIAYHNTAKIFGFQYITLEEMEECIYGPPKEVTKDPAVYRETIFKNCIKMMEQVSECIVKLFPKQTVRVTFETGEHRHDPMNVWIQPLNKGSTDSEDRFSLEKMVQLEVFTESHVLGVEMDKHQAMWKDDWVVHYHIERVPSGQFTIKDSYGATKERQMMALSLPSSVTSATIDNMFKLHNFNFSRTLSQDDLEAKLVPLILGDLSLPKTPGRDARLGKRFMLPSDYTLKMREDIKSRAGAKEGEDDLDQDEDLDLDDVPSKDDRDMQF